MNYEYYRMFYYVGKHRNFTRAAAELYTSQPAVTRTIQRLETELGCLLFVRHKAGVEFTHEGQILFDYVSSAHSQLMKGEEEVNRAAGTESGTIYIGTTVTALRGFLFSFLDHFHLEHPGIKFKISTDSTNGVIERLKSGVVDLAFVSTPCSAAKTLPTKVLWQFNDILIAGSGYQHLRDRILTASEVTAYPLVCLRKGMQLREFIDDYFAENGLTTSPDIELDGADLIVPMVSHNFGVGFVPQNMAEDAIERGEVFRIRLAEELPSRQICLITDPHHPRSRASRELSKAILRSVHNEE